MRRCEIWNLTAKFLWRFKTCGTWGRVVESITSDVSEHRVSHILRVKTNPKTSSSTVVKTSAKLWSWIVRNFRKQTLKAKGQIPELLFFFRIRKMFISKTPEELNMFSTVHLPRNDIQVNRTLWYRYIRLPVHNDAPWKWLQITAETYRSGWLLIDKCNLLVTKLFDGFGGLVVSMLASGTRVRGFNPGGSRWIFPVW
jgi:hypothetical protein